jgi:suppressor of fused
MPDEFAAAGWDAISTALDRIYPDVQPRHLTPMISARLGGPDPLDGLSIYRLRLRVRVHVSVARIDLEPPNWAINFLSNLARYVTSTGNTFRAGHHMDLNGPIALSAEDTAIRAITFATDPELGEIDTPLGRVRFLQVIGITLDEYAVIEQWDAERLVAAMAPRLPLLVTDLRRPSLTTDPAVAADVTEGIRRDGSSTGSLYVAESRVVRHGAGATLTFGANAAPRIGRVLAARVPFGRGLMVDGPDGGVGIRPGDAFAVGDLGAGLVEVVLPSMVLDELCSVLRPIAGRYALSTAPLTVEIVKSYIRDQDQQVISEIG